MDDLKFYSSVELEQTTLIEIIKNIREEPTNITLDNTSTDLETDVDSMFKIESEHVIVQALFDAFPRTNFITESFDLYGIRPTVIHLH